MKRGLQVVNWIMPFIVCMVLLAPAAFAQSVREAKDGEVIQPGTVGMLEIVDNPNKRIDIQGPTVTQAFTVTHTGAVQRNAWVGYTDRNSAAAAMSQQVTNRLQQACKAGSGLTDYSVMKNGQVQTNPNCNVGAVATAPVAAVPPPTKLCFKEVAFCVSEKFSAYWQQHGGLQDFGFPLTNETFEFLGGKPYIVQYFERARLEWHPENKPPFDILQGLWGAQMVKTAFPDGKPPTATTTGIPVPAGITLPAGSVVLVREEEFASKRAWIWFTTKTPSDLKFGKDAVSKGVDRDGWTAVGDWPDMTKVACTVAQQTSDGSLGSTGWTIQLNGQPFTGCSK